jgi:hypothetical protein
MNTPPRLRLATLALLVLLALTGCFGSLDADQAAALDEQIRAGIEKTFPLPESATIRTHVGDDLRFATDLNVDGVVTFYRDAYEAKGFAEQPGSLVSADRAALYFARDGERDAWLDVTSTETGAVFSQWSQDRNQGPAGSEPESYSVTVIKNLNRWYRQ